MLKARDYLVLGIVEGSSTFCVTITNLSLQYCTVVLHDGPGVMMISNVVCFSDAVMKYIDCPMSLMSLFFSAVK